MFEAALACCLGKNKSTKKIRKHFSLRRKIKTGSPENVNKEENLSIFYRLKEGYWRRGYSSSGASSTILVLEDALDNTSSRLAVATSSSVLLIAATSRAILSKADS